MMDRHPCILAVQYKYLTGTVRYLYCTRYINIHTRYRYPYPVYKSGHHPLVVHMLPGNGILAFSFAHVLASVWTEKKIHTVCR